MKKIVYHAEKKWKMLDAEQARENPRIAFYIKIVFLN